MGSGFRLGSAAQKSITGSEEERLAGGERVGAHTPQGHGSSGKGVWMA
jgi:hypothetical protein